jgi:Secretion system C-terminal sorting domain
MKKFTLALLALTSFSLTQAQNIQFTDPSNNDQLINGQTLYYTVSSATYIDFANHFDLKFATGQQVFIKARRVNMQMNAPGSLAWFCMRNKCYSPTQTLSNQDTIFSNASLDFSIHYAPEQYSYGVSRIRYSAYVIANPNDSAYFDVEYTTPLGINTNSLAQASISNPTPNPANSTFSLNYKLNVNASASDLVLYNMLGEKIMTRSLDEMEGNISVDVTTLPQGVYFCAIVSDKKTLVTRRLVVTH